LSESGVRPAGAAGPVEVAGSDGLVGLVAGVGVVVVCLNLGLE